MKKLLLVLCAAALIAAAIWVITPAVKAQSAQRTSVSDSSALETQADREAYLRMAAIDTSPAAFNKLDTDHDGRISALEATANPKVAAAFVMADKDKDGYLSTEEFESLNAAQTRAAPDVDASTPGGDHVSEPSGDTPATYPDSPSR